MYESIFNRDHYPTPVAVIERMLLGEEIYGKTILEPSAGAGNIVDYLQANGAKEVVASEINDKLRSILSRKCTVIGDDFLKVTAEQVSHIDMIVMNPPFTADETHILHAWAIAPAGCTIISLCNERTLSNTSWSRKRSVLKEIVELHGYDEDFDDCFKTAERSTNVNISCIKLYKPGAANEEFNGFYMTDEEEGAAQAASPGLMQYNFVRDVVNRYVMAVSKFDAAMAAAKEINDLTSFIGGSSIRFGATDSRDKYNSGITRDQFKKRLQIESWKFIFDKFEMDKYVTNGVMCKINDFVQKQINVPFTMRNIYHMIDMIIQTHGERMNQVLVEAFDLICSFSADNSTAGETWKTNTNYMVNRKFIIPNICKWDRRWPTDYMDVSSDRGMNDVVKALSNLVGIEYDRDKSLSYSFGWNRRKVYWGEWANWTFFRIKGFKKGTMHFEFLDEQVWMNFNRKVAEYKGWQLPTNTRKPGKAA